MNNFPNFQ